MILVKFYKKTNVLTEIVTASGFRLQTNPKVIDVKLADSEVTYNKPYDEFQFKNEGTIPELLVWEVE